MIQIGSRRDLDLDRADQRITFILSRKKAATGVSICPGGGEWEANSLMWLGTRFAYSINYEIVQLALKGRAQEGKGNEEPDRAGRGTVMVAGQTIFNDDLESGDLPAWSGSVGG